MPPIKTLFFIEALLVISIIIFNYSIRPEFRNFFSKKMIFLIISIPVVGLCGHQISIFIAYVFIITLLIANGPGQIACIYILMLSLFPELGENYTVGSLWLGKYSAIDALNMGALFACLWAHRNTKPIAWLDLATGLTFLISFGVLAHGAAAGPVLRDAAQSCMSIVPPYYVLSRALRTPKAATEASLFIILGALCNAIIAVFESTKRWALYENFYSQLHVHAPSVLSAQLSIRAGFLRAQGAVGNPATLSLLMGLGILACLAMKDQMTRLGQVVVIGLLLVAMLASQSRGGWIATGVGLMVFWLYQKRTTRVLGFGVAAFLGWLAITTFVPASGTIGQMVGQSGHAAGTAAYRSDLLRRGIEEVQAHPVFGQTRDQLEISMNDMRQGEGIIDFVNTPLYVALTLGLIGLALWLAAWFIPLAVAWRARHAGVHSSLRVPVELPCAMLVAVFVTLLFTSPIDRMIPLATMSIGMIGAFVTINRTKPQPQARP